MADLTTQHTLTGEWSDLVDGLGLDAGTTYVVDVVLSESSAIVRYAATDDTNPPSANVIGHPWLPRSDGGVDQRQITPESGVTIWARVNRGTAILEASEL